MHVGVSALPQFASNTNKLLYYPRVEDSNTSPDPNHRSLFPRHASLLELEVTIGIRFIIGVDYGVHHALLCGSRRNRQFPRPPNAKA